MRRNIFSIVLLAAFVLNTAIFGQVTVRLTPDERKIAEGVTADQLKNYLYFVASDEMEGRDTPSRGLDTTAKFIGMNLARWGFKPAGDNGTYYQKIDLLRYRVNPTATTASIGGQSLTWGTDFLATTNPGSVSNTPLVFGGNGWFVKSKNRDPLAGLDVKGKVVVVYAEQLPKGMTFQQLRAAGRQGVDWMDPAANAKDKGAVGVIYLPTQANITNWDRLRQQRERGAGYFVEKLRPAATADNFPALTLSQKAADALLSAEGTSFDAISKAYASDAAFPAISFNGKTATITVTTSEDRAKTQNVVAVWEGSDPVLKNEMVAIGAHYDHVGMNPNAPGPDKIWNGADDDGSGTVSVLSIAEALSKAPKRPKRSVLFVWHCGEEKGLWGSEYFNKFPTVDIKNVIAQLNIDMIGRSQDPNNIIKCGQGKPCNEELSKANEIYVIGKDMMSSTLGSIVDQTNKAYLDVQYNTRYDDPKDPNRFFFRSDHFNYAHNGIPIAFWFDGVHEDYHQPGDEPQKIDYQKMEKVARTIMLTLWELTDLKERPKIDKQLPPELAASR
jgi:Zn-dependent M28 family amino/carboxypeptidase